MNELNRALLIGEAAVDEIEVELAVLRALLFVRLMRLETVGR